MSLSLPLSGHTEGWHCERCKNGYWGDPSVGCESCNCNLSGSVSDACDSSDGQCLCKPNFSGLKCDECASGHKWNPDNPDECEPCHCNVNGSLDHFACNPRNGQCNCKVGVVGSQCNECAEGYYASGNNQLISCSGKFPWN